MSGFTSVGEIRDERTRVLTLITVAVIVSAAIGYGVASFTASPPPSPAVTRAEIVAAFRELGGPPKSLVLLTPYVQGMDDAMENALANGATNPAAQFQHLLSDGSVNVSSIHQLNSTVAAVNFAVVGATSYGIAGKRFPYGYRFVGSAILDRGQWKASWTTVCMLVEQEGELCPNPSSGMSETSVLPYSLTESAQISAETPDLLRPGALAMESDGSLLIVDGLRDQILRLAPDGALSVFAGDGKAGFSGDGGPAVDAELNLQDDVGIAVAPNGTVYIPDPTDCRLQAVYPNGIIYTVADNLAGSSNGNLICGVYDVALSPTGVPYLAAGEYVEKVAPNGTITHVAGANGAISSNGNGLTPKSIVFSPTSLAFDAEGNLDIWSFEPRVIYRLTAEGTITNLGAEYATQITSSPSGAVFVATHFGTIDRVTATGIEQVYTFTPSKISGLGWPKNFGGFQADGISVASNGVIYVDNSQGNGYGAGTALAAIEPNGAMHVVPVHTSLLETLPKVAAPGYPTSVYPAPHSAQGHALSACPSMQGLQPFNAAATALAKAVAAQYNSSLSNDLVNTDRSWWLGAFQQLQEGGNLGQHTAASVQPASKDSFSGVIAAACGERLLQDSIVVDIDGSAYSDEVSHLYFLDRRGHPLIYFQAS